MNTNFLAGRKITHSRLIITSSVILVLFYNFAFFSNVTKIYPVSAGNIPFLISLAIGLTSLSVFLFSLVSSRHTTKPVLILVFLISSLTSYFMDSYNVVIDTNMIQNTVQTDIEESMDLLSLRLILYFIFLGIIPSLYIYKADVQFGSLKTELLSKLKLLVTSLVILVAVILVFSKFYTSFFREHKPLRFYTNPVTYIYSFGNYIYESYQSGELVVTPIGTDAHTPPGDRHRELIIMVVGEAARADKFSLNGYERETNPLLKKEKIFSFSNMHSCGTTTAVSVPCMFSILNRDDYSDAKARSTQNLLDVLTHAKVNVLWRDNNSDSKGVALNVTYEDYKNPNNNPVCDDECRDEGMLVGLQEYIDNHKEGDIFIVLHQLGNHGPAYYKRYPESFEKFTPVCATNRVEECSNEEIGNAYDNAILYTDYFLSKVIGLLKENDHAFEAAMVYVADHGESLGENGLYLHGLPYFMAPASQTHIASVMWFGENFQIDREMVATRATMEFSQDNLFHTVLGLLEINTTVYDKELDILHAGE